MRVMNGLLNFTTEETKLFFSAKKRIWAFLCILGVLCGESLLHAQKRLVLDLNRTIALANDSWSHSVHRICTCPVIGSTGHIRQTACPV